MANVILDDDFSYVSNTVTAQDVTDEKTLVQAEKTAVEALLAVETDPTLSTIYASKITSLETQITDLDATKTFVDKASLTVETLRGLNKGMPFRLINRLVTRVTITP